MNLVTVTACPACGDTQKRTLRACRLDCVRLNTADFMDNTGLGTPPPEPHVHVYCQVCDFEWLTAVADLSTFEKAW